MPRLPHKNLPPATQKAAKCLKCNACHARMPWVSPSAMSPDATAALQVPPIRRYCAWQSCVRAWRSYVWQMCICDNAMCDSMRQLRVCVCDTAVCYRVVWQCFVWQSCVCVTMLYVGVCVCERVVCDKAACVRVTTLHVTKLCVCVCAPMFVWEGCVWQSCVCERECMWQCCVCVWKSCVWKTCEREREWERARVGCVKKPCVCGRHCCVCACVWQFFVWQSRVRQSSVWRLCVWQRRGRRGGVEGEMQKGRTRTPHNGAGSLCKLGWFFGKLLFGSALGCCNIITKMILDVLKLKTHHFPGRTPQVVKRESFCSAEALFVDKPEIARQVLQRVPKRRIATGCTTFF